MFEGAQHVQESMVEDALKCPPGKSPTHRRPLGDVDEGASLSYARLDWHRGGFHASKVVARVARLVRLLGRLRAEDRGLLPAGLLLLPTVPAARLPAARLLHVLRTDLLLRPRPRPRAPGRLLRGLV